MVVLVLSILQGAAEFETTQPGTGLEWMVFAAVVVPAILLVALVYLMSRKSG